MKKKRMDFEKKNKLTKNNDKAWTLVNAATLNGYSTTPVSPSRRLILRCGFTDSDSASAKSTIVE